MYRFTRPDPAERSIPLRSQVTTFPCAHNAEVALRGTENGPVTNALDTMMSDELKLKSNRRYGDDSLFFEKHIIPTTVADVTKDTDAVETWVI